MHHTIARLTVGLLAFAGLAGAQAATALPPVAPLQRIEIEPIEPRGLLLRLHSLVAVPALPQEVARQRLLIGGVAVPTAIPARVERAANGTSVTTGVRLDQVPPAVLHVPLEVVTVRWEALDEHGGVLAALSGAFDPANPDRVVADRQALLQSYVRLENLGVAPGLSGLVLSAAALVANPFSFPLRVERMTYAFVAGDAYIAIGEGPTLTLPPGGSQRAEVRQRLGYADLVAGAAGAAASGSLALEGTVLLATPLGQVELPLRLETAAER